MKVTAWYRWVVDAAHPHGFWDFNHIEDGYDPNREHPTSKVPEHDKMWKGGSWAPIECQLVNGKLVTVEPDPINKFFTFKESSRVDPKLGTIQRLHLCYRGEALAVFEERDSEEAISLLYLRARGYLATHGYLAEWTYRKLMTGEVPSWTNDLRVYP